MRRLTDSKWTLFIDSVVEIMVNGILASCRDIRVFAKVSLSIEEAKATQSSFLQPRPM